MNTLNTTPKIKDKHKLKIGKNSIMKVIDKHGVQTDLSQLLLEKTQIEQAKKDYKDMGEKFFWAQKDKLFINKFIRDNIEIINLNPSIAYKYVTKKNILSHLTLEVDKSWDPKVEFLKFKILRSFPQKPKDTNEARVFFATELPTFFESLWDCKTISELQLTVDKLCGVENLETSNRKRSADFFQRYENSEYYKKEFPDLAWWAAKFQEFKEAMWNKGIRVFDKLIRQTASMWNKNIWTEKVEDFKFADTRRKKRGVKWGSMDRRIKLENFQREGGEDLSNITPDEVMDRWNIKGIEYGNSLVDKESKISLQRFAESMSDFEKAIGVNMNDFNKVYNLGISFGSRGVWKRSSAHYEYATGVINLTKTKPDGSLAFMFWAYIDHVLAKSIWGKFNSIAKKYWLGNKTELEDKVEDKLVVEGISNFLSVVYKGDWKNKTSIVNEGKRFMRNWQIDRIKINMASNLGREPSAQELFDEIAWELKQRKNLNINQLRNALRQYAEYSLYTTNGTEVNIDTWVSSFYNHALKKWGVSLQNERLFARAFESMVRYKLEKRWMKNEFLVNYPDNSNMWLTKDECKLVEKEFDTMMDNINVHIKNRF